MSNNSCHTAGVRSLASKASATRRGLSCEPVAGLAAKLCVVFLGLCRLSPSCGPSCLPGKLSLRFVPLVLLPVTGDGYVHSLPEFSQDRHVVPTPLLTHFTLDRRQRIQAMLERIRPCTCLGDGPAAVKVTDSVDAMVVLCRGDAGAGPECRCESGSRECSC